MPITVRPKYMMREGQYLMMMMKMMKVMKVMKLMMIMKETKRHEDKDSDLILSSLPVLKDSECKSV